MAETVLIWTAAYGLTATTSLASPTRLGSPLTVAQWTRPRTPPSSPTAGAEYAEGGLKTSGVTLGGFFNTLDAERFDSLGNERTVMLVPAGQSAGDVAWVVPVIVSSHG